MEPNNLTLQGDRDALLRTRSRTAVPPSASPGLTEQGAWKSLSGVLVVVFTLFLREEEGGGREGDRDTSIYCSTFFCIHGLVLVCALARGKPATFAFGEDTLTT